MRQFYITYRQLPNLQQLAGEIPWMHNVMIMSKLKTEKEREFYLKATAKYGWSRNILVNQIKANAYQNLQINKKIA
jgi:predicted nuclease of restriction endonuclease-like (RecB) superfamily